MTTRWNPGFFFLIPIYLLLCALPAGSPARTVINELYYDHTGTDTGWEYIELFNNGPDAVDLSTYRLEFIDGATGSTRLLWEGSPGSVLDAGERVLVRGSSVLAAGEPLLGSIENGPDAVRLVSGTGTEDIVGYGETVYCEGDPAPDVPAGASLSRKPDGYDTDRNSLDFVQAGPTPGLQNFFTRDLELVPCQVSLPCSGEPFAVEFLLVNSGLERFTGRVSLSGSIGDARCGRLMDIDMEPSETTGTALDLPFAPVGAFLLLARIESDTDENCRNDTVSVPLGSSPGDIVISEIMYRPESGGSEWLEVANRSAGAILLGGWMVSDATGRKRLICEDDIPINPGGFIILAQDSNLFMLDNPVCHATVIEPAGGWPWLNDGEDGDVVTIWDPDGRIVECIGYTDLVGEERGRSIERFSIDVCSRFPGGIWHRCVAPERSTPGADNSTRIPRVPPPGKVEVAPNPFSPARDGRVKIWGMADVGEMGLLIRMFDIEGREISRLFGEENGARAFSCEWNGQTADGRDSPTGLYICVVEFVTQGGAVCRREKRCIALYR
jgi:hypothetical protein